MKRIMLIGPSGCGKTTLCQALYGQRRVYKKTQAVELVQSVIDTPGEYMENQRLNRALAVTGTQADVILLMQRWGGRRVFPPGFVGMFGQKEVRGVICQIDTCEDSALLEPARQELIQAGVAEVYCVSGITGQGVEELRSAIWGEKMKSK